MLVISDYSMVRYFIIFLISTFFSVQGKQEYLISENSNFLVVHEYDSKSDQLIIDIYSVARNRLLRRLTPTIDRKKDILEIAVSPDAKFIAVYLRESVQVWSVAAAQLLDEFYSNSKIIFCEGGSTFFIQESMPTALYVYDMVIYEKYKLRISDRDGYKKILYAPSLGYYFIQTSRGMLGVFDEEDYKLIKRFRCNDFNYSSANNSLTTYGSRRTIMRKIYDLENFSRKEKSIPLNDIKYFVINEELMKSERINITAKDFANSPSQEYGAFNCEINNEQGFFFIYSYKDQEVLQWEKLDSIFVNSELVFISDNELRLKTDLRWNLNYSYKHQKWSKDLGDKEYPMGKSSYAGFLKQNRFLNQSNYQTYSLLREERWLMKGKYFFKNNFEYKKDVNYEDLYPIGFSNNEHFLFFKKDSTFGYINLEEGWRSAYYFSQNLKLQDPIQQLDTLSPDSTFLPVKNIVRLDSVLDNDSSKVEQLFTSFQNLSFTDKRVELTVQVMDSSGNVYTGLSEHKNRKVWCEIFLKKELGPPESMKALNIQEGVLSDTSGVNVALVSDYSGSMGSLNTIRLEKGILSFIESKTDKDKITILKYDTRIKMDITSASNTRDLQRKYDKTSYEDLGGGTSLLDAAAEAIRVLRREKSMSSQIFLLTDGYENSSMATVNEVVVLAKQYGIKIHTIGIGSNIDKYMLKTLAIHTGGSFTQASNPKNLEFLYKDIRRKVNTSYTISFKRPKEQVNYTLYIRLCHPSCDSCASEYQKYVFDNSHKEIELSKVDVTDNDVFQLYSDQKKLQAEEEEEIGKIEKSDLTIDFQEPETTEASDILMVFDDLDSLEQVFERFDLPRFEFVLDTNVFIRDYSRNLKDVADFLKLHSNLVVQIQGHTDDTGSKSRNNYLSLIRAERVAEILQSMGVSQSQLQTKGFGELRPLYPNVNDKNRAMNRRIEFVLMSATSP